MPSHKGINCFIAVYGHALPEYGFKSDSATAETHIISQDGEKYSIQLHFFDTGASRHDVEVWVDGHKLEYVTMDSPYDEISLARLKDPSSKDRIVHAFFQFNALTITEDASDGQESLDAERLGTIEVKIWRAQQEVSGLVPAVFADIPDYSTTVPEKSVKGRNISHGTVLADMAPVQAPTGFGTNKIDPWDNPWVTFKFRYGSENVLRIEGLLSTQ
ncbi:hypothetical protein TWF696_004567 [Orbilia brochopaga]|uniref:DUF7918 domain-containing protein n=1 Tax=Orbilia brochopaga TaxID=3140254 RepID=A0AAV9V7B2_9PEZI